MGVMVYHKCDFCGAMQSNLDKPQMRQVVVSIEGSGNKREYVLRKDQVCKECRELLVENIHGFLESREGQGLARKNKSYPG